MTPAEALEAIRGYAGAGRYHIGAHAWIRMNQRGVRTRDVREALCSAHTCRAEGERWRVTGPDLDGDDLTLVVVVEDGVVVVTVF